MTYTVAIQHTLDGFPHTAEEQSDDSCCWQQWSHQIAEWFAQNFARLHPGRVIGHRSSLHQYTVDRITEQSNFFDMCHCVLTNGQFCHSRCKMTLSDVSFIPLNIQSNCRFVDTPKSFLGYPKDTPGLKPPVQTKKKKKEKKNCTVISS